MYRANQANFDPLIACIIIACIKHTLKGDTNRTHAKVASLFVNSNRMAARCAECHKHSLEFLIGPASANCTLRWEAELLISMRVNKHQHSSNGHVLIRGKSNACADRACQRGTAKQKAQRARLSLTASSLHAHQRIVTDGVSMQTLCQSHPNSPGLGVSAMLLCKTLKPW